MPAKYKGRDLFPLEVPRIETEGKTLYDRDTRGKNFFYLCVRTSTAGFFTSENEPVYTADGKRLYVQRF